MTRDGTVTGDFLVTFFDLFIRKNLDNDDIRSIYVFSVKDISYQRVVKVNRYAKDDLFLFNVNDEWNVILKRDGTKELFVFNLTDTSMENFLVLISSDLKILQEIKFVSSKPVSHVKLFQLHNIGENTQINRMLINLDLIKLLHFLLCNKAQICYELKFEEIKKMFNAIDIGKVLFDSFPDSDAERKLERQLYQKNLSVVTAENNGMNFMKNNNLKISFIGKTDFQSYWNFTGKPNISTFEIVDAYALKASTDADLMSIRKGIVDFIMENLNYTLLLECEQHKVGSSNRQQQVSACDDDKTGYIDNESRIAQQPQQSDYNSRYNGPLYDNLSSACKRFAALYHLFYSRKRYVERRKAISYSRIARFLTKIDFNSPDLDLLLGKAEKNGISIFLRLAESKKYANYRILFHDEASAIAMGDAPDRLIWAQTAGGYGREKSRRARPTSYRNYLEEPVLQSPPHSEKQVGNVFEGNVNEENSNIGLSSRTDDNRSRFIENEPNSFNRSKKLHKKSTKIKARTFRDLSSSDNCDKDVGQTIDNATSIVTPRQFDPMDQGEEVFILSDSDSDSGPNKEYTEDENETEVVGNTERKGKSTPIEETEQEDTLAPAHGLLKKGDMRKDSARNQIREYGNSVYYDDSNKKIIKSSNKTVQENVAVMGIELPEPTLEAARNTMTRQIGTQGKPSSELLTPPLEAFSNMKTGQYGNGEWASMSPRERQVVLLKSLDHQAKQAMLQSSNMIEDQISHTQEAQEEIAQSNFYNIEAFQKSRQRQPFSVLNGASSNGALKPSQDVPNTITKGPEELQEQSRSFGDDIGGHDTALKKIDSQKINRNFTSSQLPASSKVSQQKFQAAERPGEVASSTNRYFNIARQNGNSNKETKTGHKVEVLVNDGFNGKRRVLSTSTTFTPIKRKFTVEDKAKRDMEAICNSYKEELSSFFNSNSSTAEAFLSEIGKADVSSRLHLIESYQRQQQNTSKQETSSYVAQRYLQHLKQLPKRKFPVSWESLTDNEHTYVINELKDRVLKIVKSNNELISENCYSMEQYLKKRSAKLQQIKSKTEMQKMLFNVQAQRLRKEIDLLEKELDEG